MKRVEITNDGEVIIYNDNAVIKGEDITSHIEGSYDISEDSLRKLLVLQSDKVWVTEFNNGWRTDRIIYSREEFELESKKMYEKYLEDDKKAIKIIESMRDFVRKHNASSWWNRLKKIYINGL